MIYLATRSAAVVNTVILLGVGLCFQTSTEKEVCHTHPKSTLVKSSSPSEIEGSGTECTDEHEAEQRLALHEPFQIRKQLY